MKKKIAIASVLKPIDDVRAFWKLSQSIAKTNKYEVNIIGNASKKQPEYPNVIFHPHSIRRNDWFKRWLTREKILFKLLRLKPSVLIITTHELLNTALILRLLIGCKIIYDVQENYYLNLTRIQSSIGKKIYACLVRLKEHFARFYVSEFWLAEQCYQRELSFVKRKNIVLENKAFATATDGTIKRKKTLLFSGTISEYSGVRRAIKTYEKLTTSDPAWKLHIIGQVHDESLRTYLQSQAKVNKGITLTVSFDAIPYLHILEAISSASLGIIGYAPNPVNRNKVPTKLYEYSRYHLPFLVEQETHWSLFGCELGGAIPIDFDDIDLAKLATILKNPTELFHDLYPEKESWEAESTKIHTSLEKLTN